MHFLQNKVKWPVYAENSLVLSAAMSAVMSAFPEERRSEFLEKRSGFTDCLEMIIMNPGSQQGQEIRTIRDRNQNEEDDKEIFHEADSRNYCRI